MSADLVFVDTNVLLYAHQSANPEKAERATVVLRQLWMERRGVLSTQVLQEFAVNASRKLRPPMTRAAADAVLRAYGRWPLHQADVSDVVGALAIAGRHRLSFWDALLVQAAVRLGASVLLTEDLNHGQHIEGVTIQDPFLGLS